MKNYMERNDIFSSNRILFKELKEKNNNLVQISDSIGVTVRTLSRWNKDLKEGKLSLTHGLKGKKIKF